MTGPSWSDRKVREGSLEELRASLTAAGLIAFPTESSYGLGADPRSAKGVVTVMRIKARPPTKPLPVVVADLAQAAALGVDMEHPGLLAVAELWPSAVTVVVPIRSPLPATAGRAELALRVPDHRGLRDLLCQLGHGLTATSANRSGEPPITRAADLGDLLRDEDAWWLDGGDLAGGPPSTVVSWDQASSSLRVLRAGRASPP